MTRYLLIEVPDTAAADVVTRAVDAAAVTARVLCRGPAPAVLRVAARHCTAGQLHNLRLTDLPAIHRTVGDREFEAATAAGR